MMRPVIACVVLATLLSACSVTTSTNTTAAPSGTIAEADPAGACGCPTPRHHLKQLATTEFAPVGSNFELTFTATDDGTWEWDWDKLVLTGPDGVEHHAQPPTGELTVQVDGKFSSKTIFPFGAAIPPGLYDLDYDSWGFVTTKV